MYTNVHMYERHIISAVVWMCQIKQKLILYAKTVANNAI